VSNSYSIECATCGDGTRDISHRDDQIKALAAEWPAIKDALALVSRLADAHCWMVELTLLTGGDGSYEFAPFMLKHADHQLEIESEDRQRKPLVVGGSPQVRTFSEPVPCSLPDGMWVFVKDGKVLSANFDPVDPARADDPTNPTDANGSREPPVRACAR
jgi:hypothetical protein